MADYTGIRSKGYAPRLNAFVLMNTQDKVGAVSEARVKLLSQYEKPPAALFAVDPWEVRVIPASWGYPPRVMVTF